MYVLFICLATRCCYLDANKPGEVSQFPNIIRVNNWFNCLSSSSTRIKWRKITWKEGNTQQHSLLHSHSEPQAAAHTSHPGYVHSHVTSLGRAAILIICVLTHLSSQPLQVTLRSSSVAHWLAGCSPGSPPPLPLHGNRSHREASPPLTQMKGGHRCQQSQQPPFLQTSFPS